MILETRVVIRNLAYLLFVMSAVIAGVGICALVVRMAGGDAGTLEIEVMLLAAGSGGLFGLLLFLLGKKGAALIGQREALVRVGKFINLGIVICNENPSAKSI